MNGTQLVAIVVGAALAAAVTVMILKWFEVGGAVPIAGGVAGGIAGAIALVWPRRRNSPVAQLAHLLPPSIVWRS